MIMLGSNNLDTQGVLNTGILSISLHAVVRFQRSNNRAFPVR